MNVDPAAGARNLLLNCAGVRPGERVLIVQEDGPEAIYDRAAPDCVARVAEALGCPVSQIASPLAEQAVALPAALQAAMAEAEHSIFFNRIGDQVRFTALPGTGTKTMSYALDIGFLGAPFSTLPHQLMTEILVRLEAVIAGASRWRVTCARGSDASGSLRGALSPADDFSLKLFPLAIFAPIPCHDMSGRIVLGDWLMATANRRYQPDRLELETPVTAQVEAGRIVALAGDPALVARVRDHYRQVAERFHIDPDVVHSWHCGIHPQTFYPGPARANLERWGAVAFASPRYCHFHTCGDYSPGEIAWSLFDATIAFDDEVLWQNGRFVFLERPEIRALLTAHRAPPDSFHMRRDIGV